MFDLATSAPAVRLAIDPLLAQAGDFFGGGGIAINDEIAVIGAFLRDGDTANDVGAVYVFDVETGELLMEIGPPTDDIVGTLWFGRSVDLDGTRLIVGAEAAAAASEAAYIYDLDLEEGTYELAHKLSLGPPFSAVVRESSSR